MSASIVSNIISAKLDLILSKLNSMETKFDGLLTKVEQLSTTVSELQTTVTEHTESIATLRAELDTNKADLRALKTAFNTREQRLRATTLRIFNVPTSPGESAENFKPLAAKIYDRILRPAFVAAKASGDLGAVPQQATAVEACFRAFSPTVSPEASSGQSAAPPPVIVRLSTNAFRSAVMKNRHSVPLPPESERESGARRYVVVEDLTPDAYRLLKLLQEDRRTEKVWTTNGHIFYTRPNTIRYSKVKNIYDDVNTILA